MPVESFSAKFNYFVTTALAQLTSVFILRPIDVTIVGVSGDNSSTTMLIHHKVDTYNRTDIIRDLTQYLHDGNLTTLLSSMDDDFVYVVFLCFYEIDGL